MSTTLSFSKEKKLAIAITCLICATLAAFLFLYKLILPSSKDTVIKTYNVIDLSGIFEPSLTSLAHPEDKGSLSSKLPSGVSQSILKMETELFTHSFISSFPQSTVLRSNHIEENDAETPGKDPNQTMGKEMKNRDLPNEKSFAEGNLKNRKLVFINNVSSTNEEGCVVIKLSVNPNGEVIIAELDERRTTTLSSSLRSNALKTSLSAIFEPTSSPDIQSGSITFKFVY